MKTFIAIIVTAIIAFLWGLDIGNSNIPQEQVVVAPTPIYGDYTGYDLFDSANEYRVAQGLEPLELSFPLCNNIAARWANYKENNSHEGLNEFVLEFMPNEGIVSEILAPGATADEVVQKWAGSPSHDLFLKNNNKGCAYAAEGMGVILLSK